MNDAVNLQWLTVKTATRNLLEIDGLQIMKGKRYVIIGEVGQKKYFIKVYSHTPAI
ncbi:hypothetical protein RCG23_19815 [Neobacillus sp. PS3-34]|uniref:hypothetical protein n=1 Tax=Neobacillus sp. PS3-34 TaxID=3070678 RepID=UPI0027E01441|nr:hypothetical protein [Neobacillus sp. PS3-34]WML47608.1 hypothetical protein RCG23_19815 [Neobacillus sp. PS3-34]